MTRLNLLLKGFLFIAIFVLGYVLLVDRDIPPSGDIQGSDVAVFSSNNLSSSISSSSNSNDSTSTIFISHSWWFWFFTHILNLAFLDLTSTAEPKIFLDTCELADIDPWDPTIVRFLNPQAESAKNCKPKIKQLSNLVSGKLIVNPEKADAKCQFRCLLPKNDFNMEFGNWTDVENGTRPECDILKVECRGKNENGTMETFYKFMHAQIYRPEWVQFETGFWFLTDTNWSAPVRTSPIPATPDPEKPDVYLIIFDSVSESNFIRSMPKTQYILREYYETISFRHLNKIGLNSRPNGFAMLMGNFGNPHPDSIRANWRENFS